MSTYAQPLTLRQALVPRANLAVEAVLVAAGVLLIALSAQISIPLWFTPVPITGQTFAVLLVGSAYGATRGGVTLFCYLAAGIVGLPFFAEGKSGWDIITGFTGGYLVGMLVAAVLAGLLAERRWDRRFATATSSMLGGNVLIYAFGLPWLAYKLSEAGLPHGLNATLAAGLYPFIIGDLVKLYLAAALLPAAWRLVRRTTGR
jgi:biotin transport system substrate-specific component